MIGKVLFTKKTAKGYYGFIKCKDGSSHYFDTGSIVKGSSIQANAEVEFDVGPSRSGKTQAVNVRPVKRSSNYAPLEDEKKVLLLQVTNEMFVDRTFVDCAALPKWFQTANIEYKDYAEDLKTFIKKYLPGYTVEKNYVCDGKTYPMALLRDENERIEITPEVCDIILEDLEGIIDERGYFQAGELPGVLKNVGIKTYRDYAPNMDTFLNTYFPGKFVGKQRVAIKGKEYPKIYVYPENTDMYQENDVSATTVITSALDAATIEQIKERLFVEMEATGYILGGNMPFLLKEAGVEEYKTYATSIKDFINRYLFGDFEMKDEMLIDEKRELGVVVCKSSSLQLRILSKMYSEGNYAGFLTSLQFRHSNPLTLGITGIEMALKALAGYLNEDMESFNLNDFHKLLISAPTVFELKPYKDDERIRQLGAQTAFVPISASDYSKVFTNVHNGKKTLNNNWNGIVERFWAAKSNLAVYLTALLMIITQKETWIDIYIDEAYKEKKINELPMLLKVYSDFVPGGNMGVSLRLQKKITGHCFDCNDIPTLLEAHRYFAPGALPELSEVISYLKGSRDISAENLISWFHSGIGELIAQKITNYYWWNNSGDGINSVLVKVLSSVLWEHPATYYTTIIYNQSCPGFDRKVKEQILVDSFVQLCEEVKTYKKAFLLLSVVYFNYVKPRDIEEYDQLWEELKQELKEQVLTQLTDNVVSSRAISIFKYDSETVRELELYYCENFVAKQIGRFTSEDQFDEYINTCEENHLSFITQWIIKHTNDAGVGDKEQHLRSMLAAKQFSDALLFVRKEPYFGTDRKIELIKEILCENFKEHMFSDLAFRIYSDAIPVNIAEQSLLKNTNFAESATIMSLIITYLYKSEWIKVLYLFVPFKKMHRNTHLKFIEDLNALLTSRHIRPDDYESHYDAMRAALKVYDSAEFDAFIEWARGISIPSNSRVYAPKTKIFDANFQAMLKGGDYAEQWKQLTLMALRTDNKENQDSLRYSIIASYIGRKGLEAFDSLIMYLSSKRVNSKGYTDFYISIWKGLLSGKYSANFLRISRPLIHCAPLTFWNIFYDVAVWKNHVFESTDFELSNLNGIDHQIQQFYEEVLKRYSYTRETVFIKIALGILQFSSELTSPMFEQYIPYCSSNQNKDLLISTMIKLISMNKFQEEISLFVVADCWRHDDSETQILRIIRALCQNDYSYFLGDDLSFSQEEMDSVCSDVLGFIMHYPNIRFTHAIIESIQSCSKAYRYKLTEILLRVQTGRFQKNFIYSITGNVPRISDHEQERRAFRYYLELTVTMYKKQLAQGSQDIVYLRNRYYRILAAQILTASDRMSYSDDDIIALMQRNRHFNGVYPEYKEFKAALLALATSDMLSENQFEIFMLGLISNNWTQFIDEITSFDATALELIRKIEAYTNYRDLNMYFLKEFIYDHDPEDGSKIPCIEICAPLMAAVMKDIQEIYQTDRQKYEQCKEILVGICHLDNIDHAKAAYVNLLKYLQKCSAELREHWDMYMNALRATSYAKTFINILSDEVRNRRIDVNKVSLWQPVFVSMNEVTVYYYLLAVSYAADKRVDEAKKTYALIPSLGTLPEEWNSEHADLHAYLCGDVNYFNPSVGNAVASFYAEKEATNISFIQSISARNDSKQAADAPNVDEAVMAYRTIIRNDVEDVLKYSNYLDFFAYVKQPEDLYDVYRRVEGRHQDNKKGRLTFNELVIEYGSLIISLEDQLSHDQKLDILIELFDVFSYGIILN